jgi:hypothetical protein
MRKNRVSRQDALTFFELFNKVGESVTEDDEDPSGNFEAMDTFSCPSSEYLRQKAARFRGGRGSSDV